MKKTVLDESASIYNHEPEKTPRQNFRQLKGREKLRYFKDYYLLRAVLVILAVALVGDVIWQVAFSSDPSYALQIAVMETALEAEPAQALKDALAAQLKEADPEGTGEVYLDDSFGIAGGEMKLSVYMASGQLDAMICSGERFRDYAGQGILMDLRQVPGLDLGDALVWAAGYAPQESEDPSGAGGQGAGEVAPYGVSLAGNAAVRASMPGMEEPVIGILLAATHPERAAIAIRALAG